MRPGYSWLASFALLPLVGAPLVVRGPVRAFSRVSRLVLAAGAGAVLLSFAMTVFAFAGTRWNLIALLLAATLLAFGLDRLTEAHAPPRLYAAAARDGRLLGPVARLLALVAIVAAAIAAATGAAGSNDLVFFWGPKAQQFAAARTIDAAFLKSPLNDYMHPPYPPLVTNLFAFASMIAGRFAWGAATLTFPLLLAAIAAGLPGTLRGAAAPRTVLANTALLVSALAYFGIVGNVAGNGDMPLLFFEILAMALLISPEASGAGIQLLAGILLAGAATAKVEGLPFTLASAVLFVLVRRDRATSALKSLLLLLSPTAAALGAWFAFGISRGVFHQYESYGSLWKVYPDHLATVVRAVGDSLWYTGYALPFVVPLLALLLQARWSKSMLLPLGVATALTAFFLFTYLHQESDPSEWIAWSAGRIFSPLPALFALAAMCEPRQAAAARETPRRGASPG